MSIDAMKQALEALKECSRVPHIRGLQPTIAALRLAIEQAERQEPVAWVTGWHDGHCVIRAANPAAILPIGIALYTTPPRREWVGLTEAEAVQVAIDCGCLDVAWLVFARAIEAKLKEKNA